MASTLVFAGDASPSTLSGRVARGELARLTRGVYTTQTGDPAGVIRAEWRAIVGHLLPAAVITDRSAALAGPVDVGLYLARPSRTRDVTMPGLTVRTRPGIGPVEGDILLPGGLYQASITRGLLENLMPSRSTGGRPGRTFNGRELGDWIDRLARVYGARRLLEFRADAEHLAPALDVAPTRVQPLSDLIGAAVGTRTSDGVESPALAARQAGLPYDSDPVARFELLAGALRAAAPQNRPADPADPRWLHLPFFEAYFSNYIEGTEFPLDVAERVVYHGEVPPARPADAHDLTGTYEIVSDLAEMSAIAGDATQFLEIIQHRHAIVMAGRPETQPGRFKLDANRAAVTEFVDPALVEGTLRVGFDRLASLDTAWERSVYTMFLISEVHPFNDGNGRIARIMMNAELVAGGQARIIIPTVFRDDYLGALRRLTRSDDPSILIKRCDTHATTPARSTSHPSASRPSSSAPPTHSTIPTARHAYASQRPPKPPRAVGHSRPAPRWNRGRQTYLASRAAVPTARTGWSGSRVRSPPARARPQVRTATTVQTTSPAGRPVMRRSSRVASGHRGRRARLLLPSWLLLPGGCSNTTGRSLTRSST